MRRNVYRGSNGRYYGDVDVWERFERGEWTPCCWDEENGREWVRTAEEELLALIPVPRSDVPAGLTVTTVRGGVVVEGNRAPVSTPTNCSSH